jgi:hypothetical protein
MVPELLHVKQGARSILDMSQRRPVRVHWWRADRKPLCYYDGEPVSLSPEQRKKTPYLRRLSLRARVAGPERGDAVPRVRHTGHTTG